MTRTHWDNCIAHFDQAVETFVGEYFGNKDRRCLLVAAAGFDPRSRRIAELLADQMGDRLQAFFVREERGRPDTGLAAAADANETRLRSLVPDCKVVRIDVFGDDGAPVGGPRMARLVSDLVLPPEITDVVLDMTAFSVGIAFPAARILLEGCERNGRRSFHVMVSSNPELESRIVAEHGGRPMAVRGFAGTDILSETLDVARMWIPQLAPGNASVSALDQIGRSLGQCYKICPALPFPSRDPRRSDALVAEYGKALVDEWQVDPRDLVHLSERNPLDSYRTLSTLARRYRKAVENVFAPVIVVSPMGGRVMAIGAFMAAIEHGLAVSYVETVRYEFDASGPFDDEPPDTLLHVLLSGPAYGDYDDAIDELTAAGPPWASGNGTAAGERT